MKKINKKQLINSLIDDIDLWDLSVYRTERAMFRSIVTYVVNETLREVKVCQQKL